MTTFTLSNTVKRLIVFILLVLAIIQAISWISILNYDFYVKYLYSRTLHNPLMLIDAFLFLIAVLLLILWSIRVIKMDRMALCFILILTTSHLIMGYLDIMGRV